MDARNVGRRLHVGAAVLLVALAAVTAAACGSSTPSSSASVATQPPPPATPEPFGRLTCVPQGGIRFCPGGSDVDGRDLRVPSFDGVPLDADLALPATGRGPFPLIVLLHGLGLTKTSWEVGGLGAGTFTPPAEDDVSLAAEGWAVLMYTARGFGDSCGTTASRAGTPACSPGWIQLADQRYEVRDTQYLAGLLVDEGLVRPSIAVAGVSYGGGQTLELAALKDRVRLTDGSLVPWTSPVHHVPMSVGAAFAQWPWDNLANALVPNGHVSTTTPQPLSAEIVPPGVPKSSWTSLLYGVTTSGYLSPPGADPTSDLTTWYAGLTKGEPFTATDAFALTTVQDDKSAFGIPLPPGGPAPTAIESGTTDTLFPVTEALQYAQRVAAAGDHTPLLLLFGDLGHGWAQNKPDTLDPTTADGLAFLRTVVQDHGTPRTGTVAYATTCPGTAPSGPPLTGTSLAALGHGTVPLTGAPSQEVTSAGGDPATAAALDPAYAGQPLCHPLPAAREPGTAVYTRSVGPTPLTLVGGATVTARLHVVGPYPEIVARLWDVAPDGSTRQIVALDVFRPSVNQLASTGPTTAADTTMDLTLDPNVYTFPAGDTAELELVGSNAPLFRASNGTFSVAVTGATVTLPVS